MIKLVCYQNFTLRYPKHDSQIRNIDIDRIWMGGFALYQLKVKIIFRSINANKPII